MGSTEIISLLLGGGLVTILTASNGAIRNWREGKVAKEDTAISRWRDIATHEARNSRKAWTIVAAYRRWYGPLYVAYMSTPGAKLDFPPDPTPPEEPDDPDPEGER